MNINDLVSSIKVQTILARRLSELAKKPSLETRSSKGVVSLRSEPREKPEPTKARTQLAFPSAYTISCGGARVWRNPGVAQHHVFVRPGLDVSPVSTCRNGGKVSLPSSHLFRPDILLYTAHVISLSLTHTHPLGHCCLALL